MSVSMRSRNVVNCGRGEAVPRREERLASEVIAVNRGEDAFSEIEPRAMEWSVVCGGGNTA